MGAMVRPRPDPRPGGGLRPRVSGRFLYVGDEKLWVRGVTYGTFLPTAPGDDGYDPAKADEDFARMAAAGINAIRVYTVPPAWLLDAAQRHGLWVAVDLPWEEHITFLDQRGLPGKIRERLAASVRSCAGHPAILAFSIGNEIPSRIVRWHGAPAVEGFLESLADAVRAADPGALVTYVNYPSTEYLRVRGIDYDSWNVYLEDDEDFERYVARLQNLSPDRPVVIAELGADSLRKGADFQAHLVSTQVRRDVRGRRLGHVRVRLDGRVGTQRRGGGGLGLRPDDPRPAAQARARRPRAGVSRGALSGRPGLAAHLRRLLLVQRGEVHRRLPRRAWRARTTPTTRSSSSTTARPMTRRPSPRATTCA